MCPVQNIQEQQERQKDKGLTMTISHNSDTDCGPDTYGVLAQLVAQRIVCPKVASSSLVRPATQEAAAA